MSYLPRLRIGAKLGISAGIGVALVVGMLANEQFGNASMSDANRLVSVNHANKANALSASIAMERSQMALKDIYLARTEAQIDARFETLRASAVEAAANADAAAQRASREQVKIKYRKLKSSIETYLAIAGELTATQKLGLAALTRQERDGAAFAKSLDGMVASASFTALPERGAIERSIYQASAAVAAARAAAWRLGTTGEAEQKERLNSTMGAVIAALDRARPMIGDKTLGAEIDGIIAVARDLQKASQELIKSQDAKTGIVDQRMAPLTKEIADGIAEGVTIGTDMVALRQSEFVAELTRAGWVGLAIGIPVVLILIGSAVFSMFTIARPIRCIGEVLLELAGGNKSVEIPYATRSDEVGDNARAAKNFKDNLLRIEQMETEQRETEHRAADRRKADMHKLAADFESAVGEIIESVASAATELEAAATTLTHTAENTQQLSTVVANASDEASSNVQSVASSTEELTASVNEISRQVQESSRIASEAVNQAQLTDVRINELSHAAGRIGDVVKLITAVAEQTNLLALNATIEAARAGEAGRGFAVVASEVKNLANQTAKATDEISTQIAGMQSATQVSVTAIKEIGSTISRISEIATTIASAVEEQGAATQEISRNVQQAAAGTTQVASNIVAVNKGAGETGSASSQVLSSARALSTEGNKLKVEVKRFLATVRAA
jgi:methyl-accepting chemotaxis protein